MADEKLAQLASALINEAANRLLLIPGTRGVFITLVHEDTDMPLGTCVLHDEAHPRDVVMALRRLLDSGEVLTTLLLKHMDGSGSGREDSTDMGEQNDGAAIADGGGGSADEEAAGSKPAAKETES